MKKLVTVLLIAILLANSIMAGGNKETEVSGDHLERIKAKGEIIIAMEGTWAPWTYHDENNTLVGFDTEIGEAIANKLGVKPLFIEGEWDGLLAGLDAGRYDIMINGVDITAERSQKYDFSTPYAYNKTAVITKSDDNSISTMQDLKGKRTANTISSTYAEVAEKYGANVTGVDDLIQTFELLKSGRIDATLNAEVTYYDYMKAHPSAEFKIACLDPTVTSVAIPLKKGEDNKTLLDAINNVLKELKNEGVLKELSIKYFGADITE